QPLNISFDERGRMWVVQYIQYPFPAGLKVVEYDRYIRAKFDKTPLPPPKHFPGHDKITIHEDVDGDGSFRKVKTFVDGLNIATSVLHGRGGVWVMNPPYLLFYPDKDRDDVPDSDPVVHLAGFGLEDTHAVASSLMWGPDGWIYGAQGSTCVANIRAPLSKEPEKVTKFLGQAIWRYQPEEHRFEIFAEGGGNTFGVEFDDEGNLFSGTNWGQYRGVHYVQGGYYVKGWGKHGPLTNPYAFGFFGHMPHVGNADRLTHTFVVYGGGLLGKEYEGKIIGPNPLMSRITVTRLKREGSTFKTVEEAPMMTSDDGWFRPVDLKTGPDGAIYIADFYEKRISHVDPRDTWDRSNGRIWRIRPADWKAGIKPFDMGKLNGEELVNRLGDKNRWVRATTLRLLGDKQDKPSPWRLRRTRNDSQDHVALEALWALHATEELRDEDWLDALKHLNPDVRRWGIRMFGDLPGKASAAVVWRLIELSQSEKDPQVRSQIASTLKRINSEGVSAVLAAMLDHPANDAKDAHIPLLLWWAVEAKLKTNRESVLAVLQDSWNSEVARETIFARLARRLASEPTEENQKALVAMLEKAPGDGERKILMEGIGEAFKGRTMENLSPGLAEALKKWGGQELAVRAGDAAAMAAALDLIQNDRAEFKTQRIELIQILGQVGKAEAIPVLLEAAEKSQWHSVRKAAFSALTHFEDGGIGKGIVEMYGKLPGDQGVRGAAISALTSREAWAEELVKGVKSGVIAKADITAEQIERIRQLENPALTAMADATFGAGKASSEEKQREMERVAGVLKTGSGDAGVGKGIFMARCGTCHSLFGEGGKTGPDLTGYERKNLDFLLLSIVDPSAYVREEYTNFRIKTNDGQTLFGLISERGAMQITLTDSSLEKSVIPKNRIKDERALATSIMPEELLNGLNERELRDLFAYLSAVKGP
ncbi:MAG TPA: PVC-type heme-binding CxxCH protein, partial [Tepidisphaeraceae bacterium]|nr:PVC-type heme-binding CxxCH protein [Tepidisphaeraceae bacterium]